ncbi:MAG: hypothetical protein M0Q93_00505 [Terrimicrobiaceae bacterium]|nr:hypothetical protein [Terrimicrobiaceae bacterium]
MPKLSLRQPVQPQRIVVTSEGVTPVLGGIAGIEGEDLAEEASELAPGQVAEQEEPEIVQAAPKPPIKLNIKKTRPEVATAVPGPENKPSEWEGRDVFVGFPCYKQTNPVTAWCLVALALDFGREKIRFDMEIGDAMIYHARNRLAMKFLATESNWLLFIDDDMIPPIGRPGFLKEMARLPDTYPADPMGLHVVHRLMGHGKELVGATYFARHPNGRAINSLWQDANYLAQAVRFQDSLFPCDWVGTGCMLIHRTVFEKMMTKFPELRPANSELPWNFFQPLQDGRGEDIAFCARARECGVQPFVDAKLHAIHVGYGTYGVHTRL